MELSNIFKTLNEKFVDSLEFPENSNYIKVINVLKWHDIALFIKQDNNLKFDYLMCISSYDVGDKKTY